mgnify:CR=1 FL=1
MDFLTLLKKMLKNFWFVKCLLYIHTVISYKKPVLLLRKH